MFVLKIISMNPFHFNCKAIVKLYFHLKMSIFLKYFKFHLQIYYSSFSKFNFYLELH